MKEQFSREKDQGLQTDNGRSGSIVFFAMILFLLIFIDPKRSTEQQKINEIGMQKAKIIAYQIYNRNYQTGRSPASIQNDSSGGQMGLDPWGQAFRYRFIFDEKINKRKLIVWSIGANGKVDSPALANEDQNSPDISYLGDDFGFEIQMLN